MWREYREGWTILGEFGGLKKIYKLYIHPHDKEYAKRLGGRWNPINLTWEFKYMMTSQKFMHSVLRLKKKERDEKLKCYIFDRLEEINFSIKELKEKKNKYFLDNSKFIFEYFENKKNINNIEEQQNKIITTKNQFDKDALCVTR